MQGSHSQEGGESQSWNLQAPFPVLLLAHPWHNSHPKMAQPWYNQPKMVHSTTSPRLTEHQEKMTMNGQQWAEKVHVHGSFLVSKLSFALVLYNITWIGLQKLTSLSSNHKYMQKQTSCDLFANIFLFFTAATVIAFAWMFWLLRMITLNLVLWFSVGSILLPGIYYYNTWIVMITIVLFHLAYAALSKTAK